ncbi:MAG: hypothetical protein ACOZDY_08110 [Pseudomonadota bacterium]
MGSLTGEVLRADPRLRRRALAAVAAVLVAGVVALARGVPAAAARLTKQPPQQALPLIPGA